MVNTQRYSQFVTHWKNVQFPARPSPEEIFVFDALLQSHEGKSLLILGATPELRDLGAKHHLRVTCLDVNPDMLEGMKELMQQSNPDEQLVKGNWLDMPFPENTFDLVFAEQSIHIIPIQNFEKFLSQVKKVMKKIGIFVLKALIISEEDTDTIIKKARAQHRDIFYLHDKLFNNAVNYNEGRAGYASFQSYLSQLVKQAKLSRKEYNQFIKVYSPLCEADLQIFGLPKEAFEALLRQHFTIREIRYGEDFDKHSLHPIYVLQK